MDIEWQYDENLAETFDKNPIVHRMIIGIRSTIV